MRQMQAVAIVPAHNEAPRVAAVVAPLRASGRFARVLVVDDGSTDDTAGAARAAGAQVLTLRPNRGKGGAMLAGLRATREPVVAFFDADLVALHPAHVHWLLDPVTRGEAGMCAGLRDYGGVYNRFQGALPLITGERAVRREILDAVPARFWDGFAIEAAINAAAERFGMPVVTTILNGVEQVPKWQKVGVRKGISDATKMMVRVLRAIRDAEADR